MYIKKGHDPQNEKTIYGMGENTYKLYMLKDLISRIYKELKQQQKDKQLNF